MTTETLESREGLDKRFAQPASTGMIDQTADALRARGFTVETLADASAARDRVRELLPRGSTVFTAASETLRLSGIDEDINSSDAYDAVRPQVWSMNRTTEEAAIRRLTATPDIVIGSVSAVTASGSLIAVSATGSQLAAYAGGAGRAILVIGAQKIVPDLETALRRIEEYALPLETERARRLYGKPSAINKILILNRDGFGPRTTVLLLRVAIGF
jgi:hypothetical protein